MVEMCMSLFVLVRIMDANTKITLFKFIWFIHSFTRSSLRLRTTEDRKRTNDKYASRERQSIVGVSTNNKQT